ncbi:hypothetical protein ACJX0J_013133, partial [Zea mays]
MVGDEEKKLPLYLQALIRVKAEGMLRTCFGEAGKVLIYVLSCHILILFLQIYFINLYQISNVLIIYPYDYEDINIKSGITDNKLVRSTRRENVGTEKNMNSEVSLWYSKRKFVKQTRNISEKKLWHF